MVKWYITRVFSFFFVVVCLKITIYRVYTVLQYEEQLMVVWREKNSFKNLFFLVIKLLLARDERRQFVIHVPRVHDERFPVVPATPHTLLAGSQPIVDGGRR